GYFVEIPDGTLAPIGARVAFNVVNGYPSVSLDDLQMQEFTPPSHFIFARRENEMTLSPEAIGIEHWKQQIDYHTHGLNVPTPPERYLAIRVLESRTLGSEDFNPCIAQLPSTGKTLGQQLIP